LLFASVVVLVPVLLFSSFRHHKINTSPLSLSCDLRIKESARATMRMQPIIESIGDPETKVTTAASSGTDVLSETFSNDVFEKRFPREEGREYVSLPDDVYGMFFLSNLFGPAFWYSLYVFILKIALYTFLALDVSKKNRPDPDQVDKTVLAAQFLMLPVAVAMQEDLTATYYLLGKLSNLVSGECVDE